MEKISISNLPVGIFKINSNKKMTYVNKRFCEIAKYPKEKLLNEKWLNVIHKEDLHKFMPALLFSMSHRNIHEFKFRFIHDKTEIWVQCNVVPEKISGKIINYIGTIADITDLISTQAAFQALARFDPLTQLPNRYLFEDILKKSMQRSKRNKTMLALFYADLDYFKNVNDFYGHVVGDKLLKEAALRFKKIVRYEDFIVRLGGDEFAIIFEDISNMNRISLMAERLVEEFQRPFLIGTHEIMTTLSIGISVYPDEKTTPESIVQHADQALYQAKKYGRSRYRYYNKSMQYQLERYMLIVKHLRHAIEANQFEMYYQPKIHIKTQKIAGMEALLRWNCPEVPHCFPAEFIIIAEETGLMKNIGDWVIRTALFQFKEWYEYTDKLKDITISINVSAAQLNETSILETITEVLKETKIPTKNILFELTETAVMKHAIDKKSLLPVFLEELGIGISIDDFGTGYSSFIYLKELPIKELKIDKTFVSDIGKTKNNEVLIKAIINLAHTLDLKITAEGVENDEQLKFLKRNKCDIIQGYYYSKPLTKDEMKKYLKANL